MNIDTIARLHDISSRLDHLENSAEWIARTMEDMDPATSQTGSLISLLADDIRDRIMELVTELEKQVVVFGATQ